MGTSDQTGGTIIILITIIIISTSFVFLSWYNLSLTCQPGQSKNSKCWENVAEAGPTNWWSVSLLGPKGTGMRYMSCMD